MRHPQNSQADLKEMQIQNLVVLLVFVSSFSFQDDFSSSQAGQEGLSTSRKGKDEDPGHRSMKP